MNPLQAFSLAGSLDWMNAMENELRPSWENTFEGQRQIAAGRLMRGEDFLTVASDNKISPRTLLAWRAHEYGKWINDPHEGRGPGPSRDYDGEWPSEREELREYATMRLDPARFLDENLRERYTKFLQGWNSDDGAVSASKIRRLNRRQRKKQRLGEFEGN